MSYLVPILQLERNDFKNDTQIYCKLTCNVESQKQLPCNQICFKLFEQSGRESTLLNRGYMSYNYTFHCCGINSECSKSGLVYIRGFLNLKYIYYPFPNISEKSLTFLSYHIYLIICIF